MSKTEIITLENVTKDVIKPHGYVAIIAGGRGTRLWPLSYPDCPKQFCPLNDKETYIQASVKRFVGIGFKPQQFIIIVTNERQKELAEDQLLPLGVLSQNICMLPPTLGYPGCMTWATNYAFSLDKSAVVVNSPSDQYIVADDGFTRTVNLSVLNAYQKKITIVGVKVNDINTVMGCGHAEFDPEEEEETKRILGFVEKPDCKLADSIMRKGNTACNTGINVWKASTVVKRVGEARTMSMPEFMELLGEKYVVVGDFEWHDCGTFKEIYKISPKTPNHKNASIGPNIYRSNCLRSLFFNAIGDDVEVFVDHIEDTAIVLNMIDGVPVAGAYDFEKSQLVGNLADDFEKNHDIISADYSVGARNNMIISSNMSDDLKAGFVGKDNIKITAVKNPITGKITFAITGK